MYTPFRHLPGATLLLLLILLLGAAASPVFAQAYCSLRDPVISIDRLFPEADNYRSVVRVVDRAVRQQVSRELPPNTLHFGELGRHTLYIALKDNIPLGFVHSRSEQSRWGLIEVAWALDLSLRIKDFHLQRCRNAACNDLQALQFRRHFFKKSYAQLRDMLAPDNRSVDDSQLPLPEKSKALAGAILVCGIKTALITQYVWGKEVAEAQMLARARQAFNDAATVELVPDFRSERAAAGVRAEQAQLARAYDKQGRLLGAVFHAPHDIEGQAYPVWWAIDNRAAIAGVASDSGWPSEQVGRVFDATVGKSFSASQQCANQVELMALEATRTTMANLKE